MFSFPAEAHQTRGLQTEGSCRFSDVPLWRRVEEAFAWILPLRQPTSGARSGNSNRGRTTIQEALTGSGGREGS